MFYFPDQNLTLKVGFKVGFKKGLLFVFRPGVKCGYEFGSLPKNEVPFASKFISQSKPKSQFFFENTICHIPHKRVTEKCQK